jgi:hypothetical protein
VGDSHARGDRDHLPMHPMLLKFVRAGRAAMLPLLMSIGLLLPGASASAAGSLNSGSAVHPYVQYATQVSPNQP